MTVFGAFELPLHLLFTRKGPVCRGIHRSRRSLLLAITPALLVGVGCHPEPCAYYKTIAVSSQTSPFTDGTSVFSKCGPCPELPVVEGVDASGPATLCTVSFNDRDNDRAVVDCWYGPQGHTSSSISNGAVTDVPNLFGFCEANCPNEDALHGCSLTADANGVNSLVCLYGQACG